MAASIISGVESGHRSLRYKHIKTICSALNLDPAFFFDTETAKEERLGENLRQIRYALGLTQEELGS